MGPLERASKLGEWGVVCGTLRSTHALARCLGRDCAPGTTFALVGPLGAGKTAFVQGLAKVLGVPEGTRVVSPSYALVNEYPGADAPLVHADLFRLETLDDALALGIDDQLNREDAVIAVEWADSMPELLPDGTLWLHFTPQDDGSRHVRVSGLPRPSRLRLPRTPSP